MIPILNRRKNKSKSPSYPPQPNKQLLQINGTYNQQAHANLRRVRKDHWTQTSGFQTIKKYRRPGNSSITDYLRSKKSTLVAFKDLQKTFDKICKDGILVKLLRSGISRRMYKRSKSYLNNRKSQSFDWYFERKSFSGQGIIQGGVLPLPYLSSI